MKQVNNIKSLFVVGLSTVVVVGCTQSQSVVTNSESDVHSPLILTTDELKDLGLTTAVATVKSVPVRIALAGTIQANPNLTTPVSSLVPGSIELVKVQHGDSVKRGDVLAVIRSDEVGQIENEFLSKLVELDADQRALKVQLALKQKIFDRRRVLLDEKIAARAEYEQAESDLDESKVELNSVEDKRQAFYRSTRERIRLFGLPESELNRLVQSRTIEESFPVYSPRAGIITARDADAGQIIESGKVLFQVSDLSRVWIIAQVFEKDIRSVRKGLPVEVQVESFPGETFHGVLDFVGSQIDSDTRTLAVRATIANPGIRLKPEMFARITVKIGEATGLAVPKDAVQQIGESSVVYIAHGKNNFDERQVHVGQVIGDMVEIVDGLKPGETVVVNGSLQLVGQSVRRLNQ